MKEPEHPVREAFLEAADSMTAWREQQWTAMTAAQQKEYERIEREKRKKRKEAEAAFYRDRAELVEKEKRKLLLQRPELVLRMLPGRLKERRAEAVAARNVRGRHEQFMRQLMEEKMRALDDYMKRAETERAGARDADLKREFTQALRARAMQKEREKGGRGERER